ncbi:MAG: AraC family transcriptional regulator [Saprospiraceae bacterium]
MTILKTPISINNFNAFINNPNAQFLLIDQFYKPHQRFASHSDYFSKISIVLNGQLKEGLGKKEEYANTASLVIKPNSAIHTNVFGPRGTRIISVLMHDHFWQSMNMDHQLDELKWFHGLQYAKASIKFVQEVFSGKSHHEMEESIIALLANLQHTPLSSSTPPLWLQGVKERLEDEWEMLLSVQTLAQWVDVHPVYLARIFRKFYHCSIKDFVRQTRVRKVMDLLGSTNISLAQIAFDAGYADQSHFTRQFKVEMGMSPGAFRQLVEDRKPTAIREDLRMLSKLSAAELKY